MNRFPHRLTSFLLLAAYLCASTVGGVLHSHEHDSAPCSVKHRASESGRAAGHDGHKHAHSAGPSHPHPAGHCHAHHRHGKHQQEQQSAQQAAHLASHGKPAAQEHSNSPEHHDHDDCTVCRFLGQVSLIAQFAQVDMPLGLSAERPVSDVSTPYYGVARATLHLRAGPAEV